MRFLVDRHMNLLVVKEMRVKSDDEIIGVIEENLKKETGLTFFCGTGNKVIVNGIEYKRFATHITEGQLSGYATIEE